MGAVRKLLNRIRRDNRGSAIVMVVIALSFIGILGVTVMWISLSNYRMKENDSSNKQGFYTAESVLEQIKIGLQGDASKASAAAYSVVMQNFSEWNEDQRQSMFQQEFKKNLVAILSDGTGTTNHYSVDHLASFIDGNLHISTDSTDKGDPIRYLTGSTVIGDYEVASGSAAYLMIEDIELEFTDDEGYYSNITTDIMINAPATSFMDTSTLPPIFKYALIADTGVEVGEGSLSVKGSMYAGEEGIRTNKNINVNDASYTVTKGPLDIGFGDETIDVVSNVMYASDIKIRNANLVVNSNTRVADDLTLNGTTPKVTLSGTYTGFGDSMTDTAQSSAILINGLKANVNMNGLNNLIVAGHSFVGTSKAQEAGIQTSDEGEDWSTLSGNNLDVMMGESISVKGNQLAYLIPDDCIGVKGSKTMVGKNPLTYAEYKQMVMNYSVWEDPATGDRSNTWDAAHTNNVGWQAGFDLVSTTKAISTLGNNTLSNYMPSGGQCQMIFAPSNGETMVYFYIKFADSDAANRYSRDYYNYHQNKMDAYADVYADNLLLPGGSGNMSTAASTVSKNGTSTGRGDPLTLTDAQKRECSNYRETYTALCTNLTEKYSELNSTDHNKTDQTVFENLIDESKMLSFTGGGGTKTYTTPTGFMAIITDKNEAFSYVAGDGTSESGSGYIYDASAGNDKIRIILSTHDVYVKDNFNGIIISKGKVVVGNSVTLTSTEGDTTGTLKDELMGVLQQVYNPDGTGTDLYRPIDFFYDGTAYIRANSGAEEEIGAPIDFGSSVNYQNWVKK